MRSPLVSIIIPMYNQRADFLRACIQSALSQTYENLEIIISNNHSTNGVEIIFTEFSDPRIKIIEPERHLGMADHFIFAAGFASGEFVTFLSSDDLLYPKCIECNITPLISNHAISISYSEIAYINELGSTTSLSRNGKLPSGIYSAKKIASRMYNFSEYWIIGGIMRTKDFQKEKFCTDIVAGDWVLGFKLLKYGHAAYCNEVLSAIRFHKRTGTMKANYAEQFLTHYSQSPIKHNHIIEDTELLAAVSITKKKAIAYRNKEMLGIVSKFIQDYHQKKIDQYSVKKLFVVYDIYLKGVWYKSFTRFYRSKIVLPVIFLYRVKNSIIKFLKPYDTH
jgi:glycosyltransferase involved in cell wall biosynthesis